MRRDSNYVQYTFYSGVQQRHGWSFAYTTERDNMHWAAENLTQLNDINNWKAIRVKTYLKT